MGYNATWFGRFPVPFYVRSGHRHPETVLLFRDVYAVQVFSDILRRYSMTSELLEKDQNLSEVLFKPTRKTKETSFVANSVPEDPAITENYWYRDIHLPYLGWLGFDLIEVNAALSRIAASRNRRTRPHALDTVYEYGPGNWIYEFSMLGTRHAELAETAVKQEDRPGAYRSFRLAELYFLLASYPYMVNDDLAQQSLLQHYRFYRRAAQYADGDYEEIKFRVKDTEATAFIHTPDKNSVHPAVMVFSNYQNLCTEYLRYYQELLRPNGIAMVAVDLPGVGLSGKVKFSPHLGKVHEAALNYILDHVLYLDHHKIGLLAQRMGCIAAIQLMLSAGSRIGAVCMVSPVVDEFLMSKVLAKAPPMQRDLIANRVNGDSSLWDNIIPLLQAYSVKKQGILSGFSTSVKMLVLGSKQDFYNSKADAKLVAGISSESEVRDLTGDSSIQIFEKVVLDSAEFFKKHLL